MSKTKGLRPVFAWLAVVSIGLLLALASLYLARKAGTLNNVQHSLCLNIESTSGGVTQLFRSSIPGAFSEKQSDSQELTAGAQRICFGLTIGERFLRWDPNNVASQMRVHHAEVNFWGLKQSLPIDQFALAYGVTQKAATPAADWVFENADPQTHLEISEALIARELIYSAALLALVYCLLIGFVAFILKKLIHDKSVAYRIAAFAAVLLITINQLTGLIAVGDGAGWDGNAYLTLLFDWKASGHIPDTDPYRMSRLAGFFPVVAAEFLFDLPKTQLLHTQMLFNVLGISIAAGLFVDYLRKIGISSKAAVQYTVALLLTWPMLVLPTYYPLLSDHAAILLSCLSLWCFAHKRYAYLLLSCLISPLIMPALFLLPMMLLAFSKSDAPTSWINRLALKKRSRIVLFLGLAAAMITYACHWFSRISDNELLHVGSTLAPGLPHLRILSSAYLLAALTLVAWLWSRLAEPSAALAALSLQRLLLALAAAACGHAILYFGLDWSQGFRGPELMQNIFYQGLNTPLKPILAHFIYFGPCFIIALQLLCASNRVTPQARPIQIALLGFLPVLLVGSESRQWIAILPFIVAFVAQSNISEKRRKLLLYYSLFMAAPLFWLAESVSKAWSLGLPTSDPLWQLYFGRNGPWMSQTTYLVSALALFGFVAAWWLTRSSIRRSSPKAGQSLSD